jgi:hypothetical protein
MGAVLTKRVLAVLMLVAALTLSCAAAGFAADIFKTQGEDFTLPSEVSADNDATAEGGLAARWAATGSGRTITEDVALSDDSDNVIVRARAGQTGGSPTLELRLRTGTNSLQTVGPAQSITSNTYQEYTFPATGWDLEQVTRIGVQGKNIATSRRPYVDYVRIEEPPPPPGTIDWTGDAENPTSEDWTDIYTGAGFCGDPPQNGIAPNDHRPNPTSEGYHARVTSNPTPLQGQYAYLARVDDNIDCFQERTELTQLGDNNPKQFVEYDDKYEAFGIYLADNYQTSASCQGARTVFQHKPIPSDNPVMSLKACENKWQWTTQGGSPSNPDKQVVDFGTLQTGVWYRFLGHTVYTNDSTGGIAELWSNADNVSSPDLELIGSLQKETMYDNTTAVRINGMGLYREDAASNGVEHIGHDGYAVGSTPEVVTKHAFDTPFTP